MAYLAKPAAPEEPTDMHLTEDIDGSPLWVAFDDYMFPWEEAGVSASTWLGDPAEGATASGSWDQAGGW